MKASVMALSISRHVWERLQQRSFAAQVLAVFQQVCDLLTADGDAVALVLPQVGDGPLNIVLDAGPSDLAALKPGMPAWLQERQLAVGKLQVNLQTAAVWEAKPDWGRLRAGKDTCRDRLPLVKALALQHAPEGSLLLLFSCVPGASPDPAPVGSLHPTSRVCLAAAQEALEALQAGWQGDLGRLQAGAAQLAGLGGGLTPAGDDFLHGMMLWAWLTHRTPASFCASVVHNSAPRTTALSAAFLSAAARGECSPAWHRLLTALAQGSDEEVHTALQGVLSYGATSGADALAGFLWAGQWR